jgi:type I restriction enzyme S subunit
MVPKAQVDKLTSLILAKAFRGELVPQDEQDEPAAVLLERIKAEKAENKAGKNLKLKRKAVNQSKLFE